MSIKRTSEAEWKGSISDGSGEIKLGSGASKGSIHSIRGLATTQKRRTPKS